MPDVVMMNPDDDAESHWTILAEERAAADEFARRRKALQERCLHEHLTGWLLGCYADHRCCKRCMKAVETREHKCAWTA